MHLQVLRKSMVDKITEQESGNRSCKAMVLVVGCQVGHVIAIQKTSKGTGLFLWKAAFTKKLLKHNMTRGKITETPVCLLPYEKYWIC